MKQKVILLVEDNPDDVDLTLRSLKKIGVQSEVIVARDGAEALDYLFATDAHDNRSSSIIPSLVLLDLKLPKIHGLEVLQRIRTKEHTKRLPVAILTSSDDEQDLIESYGLGVTKYIRKPVDIAQLSEVLR